MIEVFKNIIYMARRFKVATLLNLVGLVAAFATFYLLLTQITYQNTYNHEVKDYERIYRLETNYVYKEWDYSEHVCRPFADALLNLPQTQSYSLSRNDDVFSFPFQKGDQEVEYTFNVGNNAVVSALTREIIDGSIEWTDDDAQGVIIPASIAQDYFGTTQAAGKVMTLLYRIPGEPTETIELVVRGVYADFPENSELVNCIYQNMGNDDFMAFNFLYRCYVKFTEVPDDIDALTDQLRQAIIDDIGKNFHDESLKQELIKDMQGVKIKFTPLSESFFANNTFSTTNRGYKGLLVILELISLLVIIIATINFLNFTLVESPMRVRGLNTRLVLGASRHSLRIKFCAECVVISLFSCLLALVLCQLLSQLGNDGLLLDGDFKLHDYPLLVMLTLATALVVGIAAGIYPAIFATSFQPALALKGSFGLTPIGLKLRTILITFQLFVSMLMITYVGILYMQQHYIFHASYGYDKDQIFFTSIAADSKSKHLLQQALIDLPGIENVTYSTAPLGTTDAHSLIKTKTQGHNSDYNFLWTDARFLSTMGIELTEGRDFLPTDTAATIINEAARRQWHWIKIGDKLSATIENVEGDSATIIGVYKDIRYGTMRILNDQPYCFVIGGLDDLNCINLRIKADAPVGETKRRADELIMKYSGKDTQPLTSFDSKLGSIYHNELHFFHLITAISIICLVINLIGVFCMTMFETEFRRKEIGIRKVSGALTREIVWMLCKRYSWLILVSFVVAAPIACILGWRTISYFAEHTTIHWWIFALTLALVGGVMIGTVALQSWRAARENPVNSIKTD